MKRLFVRTFGTLLGLIFSAYGAAVAFGLTVGAVPCRTECQWNESLKMLLGEAAASRMIGGLWFVSGIAFVLFMNVPGRMGYRNGVARKKRRGRK